ncbi:hypothetical protein GGI07_000858 [Coemansia sp. Benny D115]|nr:hypothetical protein GGI07_000858 [Coemansia sp. Benny D115]
MHSPTTPGSAQATMVDDPLHRVVLSILAQQRTRSASDLCTLYGESSDIRACLRLFPPAYIDILTAMHPEFALSLDTGAEGKGRGVPLRQWLWEHATRQPQGADMDALKILTDHCFAQQTSQQGSSKISDLVVILVAQVHRGRADMVLREAIRGIEYGAWLRELLGAVCQAIVGGSWNMEEDPESARACSELLCLLAQLLEDYGCQSLADVGALPNLRQLARRVIKLLSEPQPTVAAPALHILTRLLLLPPQQQQQQTSSTSVSAATPLSILGDSLRHKLFDKTHIGRTLLLAADLCQNCTAGPRAAEDLVVLESIGGMFECLVGAAAVVGLQVSEMTEMTPAIDHLVALAREDRRFVHPLVRFVSALLANSEHANTPLVQGLWVDRGDDSMGPAVAEICDIVTSGIEDAPYTQPQFFRTAGNSSSAAWPRLSSDESGGGWFVNSTNVQRLHIARFLANVLKHENDAVSIDELVSQIGRALCAAAERFQNMPEAPEDLGASLGAYFWTVRPIVQVVEALSKQHSRFSNVWQTWLQQTAPELCAWITDVLGSARDSGNGISSARTTTAMLLLLRDIQSKWYSVDAADKTMFFADAMANDGRKQSGGPDSIMIEASVATPAHSSGTASPNPPISQQLSAHPPAAHISERMVIGIDAMRSAAAATVAVAATESDMKIVTSGAAMSEGKGTVDYILQQVVLRQWLRASHLEFAAMLSNSELASSTMGGFDSPLTADALPMLRVGLQALEQQSKQYRVALAQQQAALESTRALREDAEDEIAELRSAIDQIRSQHANYIGQLQQQLGLLQTERDQLNTALAEAQRICSRAEADAREWKTECVETRGRLESAEEHIKMLEARQTALREQSAGLENALGEAVARLRVIEAQAAAEKNRADEACATGARMAAHLAEYARVAESMHALSKLHQL